MAKEIAQMTAGEINRALDANGKKQSALGEKLIAAGRGYETSHETYEKDDPLSVQYRELVDRHRALRHEIDRRYGPRAPSRLPPGRFFGPIVGLGALAVAAFGSRRNGQGRS